MSDHAKCRETLRAKALEGGSEVTVSAEPPLVRGAYPAEAFTCPHGTTYWIEPTGEQIAQWVKDGTP